MKSHHFHGVQKSDPKRASALVTSLSAFCTRGKKSGHFRQIDKTYIYIHIIDFPGFQFFLWEPTFSPSAQKVKKIANGVTFPLEMSTFGTSRSLFSLGRCAKSNIFKTVPVWHNYATLVRFCKWPFLAYVYAKTASGMVQQVEFPLET